MIIVIRAFTLVTIIAMAVVPTPAAANMHWTAAEVVSTESDQCSSTVSMAVDDVGNLHLAWSDSTDVGGSGEDRDIFYRKRYLDGTWSPTEVVSTESAEASRDPAIGVDVNGTVYFAWEELDPGGTEYTEILFKKRIPGDQWTNVEVISLSTDEYHSVRPSLVVDSAGCVHVAWGLFSLSTPYLFGPIRYRSRAAGDPWNEIESLHAGTGCLEPSLAVGDDDMVHLVCIEDNWAGQVLYRFKPGGGNWSIPENVSIVGEFLIENVSLAVGTDNVLHVVWDDLHGDESFGILYSSKPVGVGQWSEELFLDGASSPYAVVAAGNCRVHVSWYQDGTVYHKMKGADGWTATEIISTESNGSSYRPCLVVDGSNVVHASWNDSTDYSGAGPDSDIFYKQNPAPSGTVSAELSCVPDWGTVPFTINIRATLSNTYALFKRRIAARMDVDMGGGRHYGSWRAGYTQLDPGESYVRAWNQIIPAFVTALGTNVFSFVVQDVTPQPYNQPPYASSGDTDTASCSVEAVAP